MLRKLRKTLTKQSRIARLPSDLSNKYQIGDLDPDTILILRTAQARDPHGVQRLLEKYNVRTAAELIPLLPKRSRPNWRKRLINWLRRLEGSYSSDPIHREFDEDAQTMRMRGYHETRIKVSISPKKGNRHV